MLFNTQNQVENIHQQENNLELSGHLAETDVQAFPRRNENTAAVYW